MAIKDIIARGIGFSPGAVQFIVTHGFGAGEAVAAAPERTTHGWKRTDLPTRKRRLTLPSGASMTVTDAQVEMIRQIIEGETAAQLAALEAKSTRKRKKAKRRETQEIKVAGEPSIVLPPQISALPGYDDKADLQAAIYQMLRVQENDALILLLMVS